ncbi:MULTISPECIES: chorismate-binding protein [Rhizobium]|uniref:Chorismate-binding protein n=1 Tax=Rhizobium aouanii TaxID=3118145 RepID=A0ABU8CLN7_9HYPH|nr:chorismate-binding protein [Rhizobium acaciae]MCW1410810.1 chorismate-binding protein [Rhizobium acaciae]MCW1742891.1 chorismate-binding protein [Rhizobium acaciae]MCW1750087.1 chorismate-binding protein [Rhizobium acaciae]
MHDTQLTRIVDRLELSREQMEVLCLQAAPFSKFILQRSAGGGLPPQFTYFGLETSPLSQSEAERLTQLSPHQQQDCAEFDKVPFKGGVFTYLPYDDGDTIGQQFWLVSKMLVVDHVDASAFAVTVIQTEDADKTYSYGACKNIVDEILAARPSGAQSQLAAGSAVDWVVDVSTEDYVGRIGEIQSRIARGELQQAILSVGLSKSTSATPEAVFEVMRRRNSSPHIFLVRGEAITLIGASPAMHLRKNGSLLTVETDAGTRRIGETEEETQAIMQELLGSEKDLEEQKMIVDETIVDLRAIADNGGVRMPVELEVRKLGSVMHLFTVLEAGIRQDLNPIQAVLSCFPPSAVTGAPRQAAMRVIKDVERQARGPYGGVVGLIGFDGSVDTAIILRSAWIDGDQITMRCGGGITHASNATDEYNECMNKARSMIECVKEAEALQEQR